MLRVTPIALRRGRPRAPASLRPLGFTLVPATHKPFQGGQQHFQTHMLARANEAAQKETSAASAIDTSRAASVIELRSPLGGFSNNRLAHMEALDSAKNVRDDFETQRSYNERLEADRAGKTAMPTSAADVASATPSLSLPEPITNNDQFTQAFGYSLVKKDSQFAKPDGAYSQLDLWAEQPKYTAGTYFLYLVARRRNAYAVIYDFQGKRIHPTYSVGNRGLRKSDKGFKADGSAENAHIVTSQYLNDVLPKIYETEIAAGRMRPGEKKKIDLVIRVLGFYNARAGGVRAVTDKQDVFNVRYFEDITPFPLNGPRMPKRMQAN